MFCTEWNASSCDSETGPYSAQNKYPCRARNRERKNLPPCRSTSRASPHRPPASVPRRAAEIYPCRPAGLSAHRYIHSTRRCIAFRSRRPWVRRSPDSRRCPCIFLLTEPCPVPFISDNIPEASAASPASSRADSPGKSTWSHRSCRWCSVHAPSTHA